MQPNDSQRTEIDRQAKTILEDAGMEAVQVQFTDKVQAKWLECSGHPAGEFDPMGRTTYCNGTCQPDGQIAVEFVYTYPRHSVEEQERTGLEVTIYDRNGDVVSSQDFG